MSSEAGLQLFKKDDQKAAGRPHHWVTPFLGKRGQIGLSRNNFASTAPFPGLSTHWIACIFLIMMVLLGSKLVR